MLNFQVSIPRVVALLPPNPFSKDHRAAFVGPVRRLPLGKCDAPGQIRVTSANCQILMFTKAVGRVTSFWKAGCECVYAPACFKQFTNLVKPLKVRENSDLLHWHVTSIIK